MTNAAYSATTSHGLCPTKRDTEVYFAWVAALSDRQIVDV